MQPGDRTLVVVVSPGASARHARDVLRWLRALLPAAILLVGSGMAPPLPEGVDDVISLDADAVESGPLSLAHALARVRKA